MSVRKAARRLGVHENTMRRYADRGLIRTIRLPSGVRRLLREDVEALSPGDGSGDEAPAQKRGYSLEELANSGIFESDEEVDAFLAMTYAERDHDR